MTSERLSQLLATRERETVEFTNPTIPHWGGNFDPDTIVPFQKNPLITKMFLQLGWVEEIGSGLLNVKKYLPFYAPQGGFTVRESDIFSVTVYLAPEQVTQQVTPPATAQATEQATEQVSKVYVQKIIEFCKIPRSFKEIQDYLQLRHREHMRKDIIEPLLQSGILERTLPDKPSSPRQKYVARGRQQ